MKPQDGLLRTPSEEALGALEKSNRRIKALEDARADVPEKFEAERARLAAIVAR